jgi:ribonuclease Z
MRVVLLGTGGYHPNERRHTACVMLPEAGILFDAGTSFFRVAERLQTRELDLFLTHAHLDHIAGLTYFLVPMWSGMVDRVRVHSAPQYLDAVRTHLFSTPFFPVQLEYEFIDIQERTPVAHGGTVTYRPLNHPGGALGFRLDWPGKSLAYITDTIADETYLDFIRNVDLLIHECNFTDDQEKLARQSGHSHSSAVARAARDAGVGRLVLVHIDPQHPEDDPVDLPRMREIFPAVELGEDLTEIEF